MSDAGSGRFVGRRTYLDELAGWLSEARAGRGRLVLLAGEAGVGKTRLAEQLAAAAGRAGVPAVWGRCPADAGAPPLWPLRRIVERLPGGPWPVPAGDEEGFGSTAEGSAAALFTRSVQLADTIVAAARPGGLLVVVEDLHWADSGTVAALGLVAAEVTGSRALVVGTARLPLEPGLTAALLERPGVEHRVLRGLERAEIVDYLSAVAGGDVDHRYADLVARQTAGNSLFVGVVARLLTERVSLRRYDAEAARTALAGRPEVAALAVAPLGRLSDEARRLVEVASVLGEDVDVPELIAACGLPAGSVPALLDEAVRAGLLSRPFDDPGSARFVHALVRDAVYAGLHRERRGELHRAVARVIAAAAPDRIGTVAGHLTRGASTPEQHGEAAECARAAGHAALSALAYAEAAAHFRAALYGLTMVGTPAPTARAETLLNLAFAEYRAGSFGSAVQHCVLAAGLAEELGRPDLLARAALLVDGVTPPDAGEALVGLCRRAILAVSDIDLAVRAQLSARLAYAAAADGDLDAAETMSAEALTLAERTAAPAAILAALRARQLALAGPGYAAARMQLGARAIGLADRGEPMAALWGRVWRVDASFELGDLVAVDRELSELAGIAAGLRFPLARWHLERLRAARESFVGRFAPAEEHALAARELAASLDDPSLAALHLAFLLFLAYVRGDRLPEGDRRETAAFLRMATESRLPIALTSAAIALVSGGDLDEAGRMARQLCSEAPGWPRDGRWIVAVPMLADVVADVGDAPCAEILYPLLAPFGGLAIAGGSGAVACNGSVSRALGRLAAVSGRYDDAVRHLLDAIGQEERMGGRPFVALSGMYLAEVLQARDGAGDLAAAAREARRALRTMRELPMPGRAMQCERLMAAVEAASRHTVLTPRERQIASLVCEGLSNRQISDRLFLSERTVETHVSHVLGKLGGSTRTDIVSWALTEGAGV